MIRRTLTIAALGLALASPAALAENACVTYTDPATGFVSCVPPGTPNPYSQSEPDGPIEGGEPMTDADRAALPPDSGLTYEPDPYTAPFKVSTRDARVVVRAVERFLWQRHRIKPTRKLRVVQVRNSLRMDGHRFPYAMALVDTDSGRMGFRTPVVVDMTLLTDKRRQLKHLRRDRRAGMPPKPPIRPDAARTAIHEVLHQVSPGASEGIVEAVAMDETAPFLKWYLGRGVKFNRGAAVWQAYPEGVFKSWKVSRKRTRSASPFTKRAERERLSMLLHRFNAGPGIVPPD